MLDAQFGTTPTTGVKLKKRIKLNYFIQDLSENPFWRWRRAGVRRENSPQISQDSPIKTLGFVEEKLCETSVDEVIGGVYVFATRVAGNVARGKKNSYAMSGIGNSFLSRDGGYDEK